MKHPVARIDRDKLTQRLSGHLLAENLPDNWHELSEEEVDKFIEENLWEPFEGWSAVDMWNLLACLVNDVVSIIEGEPDFHFLCPETPPKKKVTNVHKPHPKRGGE